MNPIFCKNTRELSINTTYIQMTKIEQFYWLNRIILSTAFQLLLL